MNRLACLLGAMTVALTGCAAVGPDYKLPAEAMVNDSRANGDFVDADSPALDRSHAARDDWWKLYNDPVLDDLVKQALQANIALRVADANLRRAYTALDIAKDEGGFSSEASASVSRTEISAESLLHTEKLPVYNLAVGGVQAAYEFDLFGKIRRGAEAASADAEVTKAARDLVRITVAARVTESYIGICEASHDIEVARHTVAIQEGAANVAQRMFGAGLGNKLDVTRAATQVDLAKAALPPLLKRREASEYALAALLGHTPGDIPSHAKSCDRAPALDRPLPIGDGMALLRRRPDIRAAERRLAGATARIGVAVADMYPTVTLGGNLGTNGLLDDYNKAPAHYWSIGPLISWSIPDHSSKLRVQLARDGADVALASFDETVLQALKETQTALSTYTHALDREETLQRAFEEATTASRQARELYSNGRTPYLSALDAERSRVQAEAALTEAESVVSEARVGLFLALGGGWQAAP